MQDLIDKAEKQPNITTGVIVSVVVILLTVLFKILFGGKKHTVCYYTFHIFAVLCISDVVVLDHYTCKLFLRCTLQVAAHEPNRGAAAETATNPGTRSSEVKADESEKEDAALRRRSTRRET